jgi:sulfate adenylyltransferase subunit 1
VFWGRVATGQVQPGHRANLPSGQLAKVAQVLTMPASPGTTWLRAQRRHRAGPRGGCVARRLDAAPTALQLTTLTPPASRPEPASRRCWLTVAWMDDEPLVPGRAYWALHGHRWVKAKVQRVLHRLDINTLAEARRHPAAPNAIGHVELALQEPVATLPFAQARVLGSLILVDTASHKTSGAVLVRVDATQGIN